MTTIATDGKALAGDGLITSNGTVFGSQFAKVTKLPDGRITGVAGSAFHVAPFVAWLEAGGDPPELDEHFDALVLSPDGTCRSYDEKCRCILEEVPTAAGSGRELAIGAMLAGASPKQAVEIAAQRDVGTGGTIVSISLNDS